MHCAEVLLLLRALTADWKVECCPEEGVLLTTRQPEGGEVRPAARATLASERKWRRYITNGGAETVDVKVGRRWAMVKDIYIHISLRS